MDAPIQPATDMAAMQMMAPSPASMGSGLRDSAAIDKASQDFESMFATQMLQPMFEGIGPDPLFGGGHAEEIMRTFLLQEYGKIIAKSGQLGISSAVKNEMIKAQAVAQNAGGPQNPNRQKGAAYASAQ